MPKNNRRQNFLSKDKSKDKASNKKDYYLFFVRSIYINFDRTSVKLTSYVIVICYFSIKINITNLDIYSLKFYNLNNNILG